jgi:hypothetical protein
VESPRIAPQEKRQITENPRDWDRADVLLYEYDYDGSKSATPTERYSIAYRMRYYLRGSVGFYLQNTPSVTIGDVKTGSDAHQAGIRTGDTIFAVNDGAVSNRFEFLTAVYKNQDKAIRIRLKHADSDAPIEVSMRVARMGAEGPEPNRYLLPAPAIRANPPPTQADWAAELEAACEAAGVSCTPTAPKASAKKDIKK